MTDKRICTGQNPISRRLTRLVDVLHMFLMEQPSTTDLAKALLTAPGWARIGLTAPREQLREAAAKELALQIQSMITGDDGLPDPRQTSLPF